MHIRRIIALKLEAAGYRVMLARNGQEAAELVHRERPDALITDLSMPHLDGKQLCEQTNALKQEWPFLTVILTARIMPGEKDWIESMNNTFFMEKPFSPTQLLEFIDKHLETST
jgi:DNA-binding response OmpR family regulator